jgi:hypothetical protein
VTKLEELEAEWKRVRNDLVSRGLLSDPTKPEGAMAKIIDGLIFIAKGQHKEIANIKQDVRSIRKGKAGKT